MKSSCAVATAQQKFCKKICAVAAAQHTMKCSCTGATVQQVVFYMICVEGPAQHIMKSFCTGATVQQVFLWSARKYSVQHTIKSFYAGATAQQQILKMFCTEGPMQNSSLSLQITANICILLHLTHWGVGKPPFAAAILRITFLNVFYLIKKTSYLA